MNSDEMHKMQFVKYYKKYNSANVTGSRITMEKPKNRTKGKRSLSGESIPSDVGQ